MNFLFQVLIVRQRRPLLHELLELIVRHLALHQVIHFLLRRLLVHHPPHIIVSGPRLDVLSHLCNGLLHVTQIHLLLEHHLHFPSLKLLLAQLVLDLFQEFRVRLQNLVNSLEGQLNDLLSSAPLRMSLRNHPVKSLPQATPTQSRASWDLDLTPLTFF